ncbi:Glycoside hydrolase-type carbohydrate-binding [Penicillium robsamsonii]|uniref:Glycoside hydrolase-type carbohydrate-binding n=1 Tax=Penicillium robsamsonii TaxID=1792511 RepID=UPI002546A35C|nr:Glycoside hydrolase-type carbohydrate-binding [Penicillium robsamsonii]KAJ5834210.1 Glycoside hydrolase-type carbohydrate-binding [Penicillium robsamsonii]
MMFFKSLAIVSLALLAKQASAAFGITTSTASYVIDAGSSNPLKFTVSRTNCDITSINYYGSELQYKSTGSHIGSGLGSATVTATQSGDYIKVTCATSTLTHYYVVHNGDSTIHMATYTTAEPSIGELRYIARLNADLLPNEEPFGVVSNIGGGSVVEGEDVFLVSGQTRSKFYSSERFIDDKIHCVSGSAHRVCMILNQYETSAGGPFHRDINTNNVGSYTGLYWYMNSGHVQTETYRQGLHGPYSMTFSRSGTPSSNIGTSFFADLDIKGYVATSGRGYVKGTASGADTAFKWVVHWYNSAAQYWTYASSSGAFTSPAMKPGTYTMVYYQGEYVVASSSVTVTAGSTTSKSISGSVKTGTTVFKIGDWDGTPNGFLNADNQLRMHPSDTRMSSWSPATYTVGTSKVSSFPMALFKSVNSPLTIKFTASSSQTGAATLRIGTTLSFASGRPQVVINSYSGPIPAAPTNLNSRGVTRGAYRGFGEVYDISIPAGTIVAGTNTITISVASGSSGETYLSPNFIFDCVELFQ